MNLQRFLSGKPFLHGRSLRGNVSEVGARGAPELRWQFREGLCGQSRLVDGGVVMSERAVAGGGGWKMTSAMTGPRASSIRRGLRARARGRTGAGPAGHARRPTTCTRRVNQCGAS